MNRKEIAIDFANSLESPVIEKIILFGSVARGDDNKDSDIDILIITSDNTNISKEIYNKVSDFVINTGEYLSVKIKTKTHYNKYKNKSLFFKNLEKEGVIIG